MTVTNGKATLRCSCTMQGTALKPLALQLRDVVAQLPVGHLLRVGRLRLEVRRRFERQLALGERLVESRPSSRRSSSAAS